jgi:DtxR family manganese transport transcriptional regulator
MPTDRIEAEVAGFRSSREARAHALVQDYCELIADLIEASGEARAVDIARRLGVAHPTVVKTVSRLKRDGLVRSEPYRSIFLTEAGQRLAAAARHRHQIVLDFLAKIGVPDAAARRDAEGIEHHVSEETLAALARFVGDAGKP